MVARDDHHDLLAQVLGRDEEGDQPVVEFMVEIAGETSGAENDAGYLVMDIALWRSLVRFCSL